MTSGDGECVKLCLDGRPEAFKHLVARYEKPLMCYLSARLGNADAAQEAAQEAFVRAYFALRKLRNREVFFPWILGIAGRVVKEVLRARRRTGGSLPPERDGVRSDPSDALDLAQAVSSLPDGYREVVLLRYYAGLSCLEVAERLGIPLGTVTKRLSRAYAALRESLESAPARGGREVQT